MFIFPRLSFSWTLKIASFLCESLFCYSSVEYETLWDLAKTIKIANNISVSAIVNGVIEVRMNVKLNFNKSFINNNSFY